jgi:hypothetical protein
MLSRGGSSVAMPLASRSPARRLISAIMVALSLTAGAVTAHGTTAGPPATLQPTSAFTAAWQQAKAAFNYCHYTLAAKRYGQIRSRGLRLEDPVLRYKFYEGIATATYAAGNKPAGVTLALAAEAVWRQMSLVQQGAVVHQTGAIEDITVGQYIYITRTSRVGVAYCKAGGHFPS